MDSGLQNRLPNLPKFLWSSLGLQSGKDISLMGLEPIKCEKKNPQRKTHKQEQQHPKILIRKAHEDKDSTRTDNMQMLQRI